MTTDNSKQASSSPESSPRKVLSPAAQRALAEAEERRAKAQQEAAAKPRELPRELQGPAGPEPTRYGDWERKGIASDF